MRQSDDASIMLEHFLTLNEELIGGKGMAERVVCKHDDQFNKLPYLTLPYLPFSHSILMVTYCIHDILLFTQLNQSKKLQ